MLDLINQLNNYDFKKMIAASERMSMKNLIKLQQHTIEELKKQTRSKYN